MSRPSAVFITDETFWRQGGGRAAQICAWLSSEFDVTAAFTGTITPADRGIIAARRYPFAVAPLSGQAAPALVVSAGLRLHALIPHGVPAVLDASEILSRRTIVEGAFEQWSENGISLNDELALMARYSFVLTSNRADHDWLSRLLHPASVVLLPMRPSQETPPPPQGRDTGKLIFAGTDCVANRHGLHWFTRSILPYLPEQLHLSVYGGACATLEAGPRVALHGEMHDTTQIHQDFAVAIDPAALRSSARVENLEALWAGLPLVTSPEGARGLDLFDGQGLFIARSRHDFCNHILTACGLAGSAHLAGSLNRIRAAYLQEAGCGYVLALLRQIGGQPIQAVAARKTLPA